ncbi:response regulator [Jiella sp. M17.18]|uniref:response regulator n=1 Tax=Jiella sp. M17.18 TaxID=3234247 RepID=UPI0034DFEDE4
MKVLIVEDEPIIAIDLEEIVLNSVAADVVLASNAAEALRQVEAGVDFVLLDVNLGREDETSLPLAHRLMQEHIPFCFVSGSLERLPATFRCVPKIAKPYRTRDVESVLPMAA